MKVAHHHHGELKGRMLFSFALNIVITLAEVIGGILSGSLALLSDSLHNFSDSMSILASYLAIKIGEREKNEKYTFGYKRAEILVAFVNSAVLVGVALFLLVEAYKRFKNPEPIDGPLMLGVALIGLFANLISVLLLHEHAHESMNVRSAYLHLLSDTLSSVAVVIGGIAIIRWDVLWIDPLVTVLISVYILREGYEILKESVEVLMEAAPDLDLDEIKREIESIPGIRNAHHFHVWRIGEKEIHFECHVEVNDMPISEAQRLIDEIEERLKRFGITHVTVQLEAGRCEDKNTICGEKGD
ncbi:cation diffusion facilitator family transporter [Thermococcus kodakarensis]|uniref:cation diffusion facilitator family transporter n=1 Tax=Thermococcus kodakarensis TaxID=311400 RepID=UPI00064F8768|nr:cation diffusion facilitator family transporter [Thermococcus kodakarensis]WCN27880.1 cation diffusion facilitator family transporter [Thermococcus kodakarensis]WCN30178.1 cation diffusion facilitator family transporter [Thermococcus kodakarensis]